MAKYYIIAGSNSYGYLHGMYDDIIIEFFNTLEEDIEDKLKDYGCGMSQAIINSYQDIYENLEEIVEEEGLNDTEAEERYWELVNEEIYFEIYKIKAQYEDMEGDKLEDIAYTKGYELFIDEYCESV